MKLNQIVAVVGGVKARTITSLTDAHHKLQKPDLLQGLSRRYQPKDEEGDQLPDEDHAVRFTVPELLTQAQLALGNLFQCVATQDVANCAAKADIVVDNKVLEKDVPLTLLLFFEKQLVDIHTMVKKLPVRDLGVTWGPSPKEDCVQSVTTQVRTKKISKPRVLYKATLEHPAQVDVVTEDVVAGYWTNTKFSGELSLDEKQAMLHSVERVQDAVKVAREKANSLDIEQSTIGSGILEYLFD